MQLRKSNSIPRKKKTYRKLQQKVILQPEITGYDNYSGLEFTGQSTSGPEKL